MKICTEKEQFGGSRKFQKKKMQDRTKKKGRFFWQKTLTYLVGTSCLGKTRNKIPRVNHVKNIVAD